MELVLGEFKHQGHPRTMGAIALLVLISTGFVSGSGALTGPERIRGAVGQSITVECQYDQIYKDYMKKWCRGDLSIGCSTVVSTDQPQRGRVLMADNKTQQILSLTVKNLKKSDEGLYQCVIERLIYIPNKRFTISLEVPEASGALTGPEKVRGEVGQSVTMECRYDLKYKDYMKKWCRGDAYVGCSAVVSTDQPRSGRTTMADNKTRGILSVTMDNLMKSDEGLYQCMIERAMLIPNERFTISLEVSEDEYILLNVPRANDVWVTSIIHVPTVSGALTGTEKVRGAVGQSVTMECQYDLKYKDYVKKWCRGDPYIGCSAVVSTDQPRSGRISMTDNKIRGILSVTVDNLMKSDEGMYQCLMERVIYIPNKRFIISLEVSEEKETSTMETTTATMGTASSQNGNHTRLEGSTETSVLLIPIRSAISWDNSGCSTLRTAQDEHHRLVRSTLKNRTHNTDGSVLMQGLAPKWRLHIFTPQIQLNPLYSSSRLLIDQIPEFCEPTDRSVQCLQTLLKIQKITRTTDLNAGDSSGAGNAE
ncbi:polymeric immunoglobulin receptor-like [Hemitrygon akajei]|uniref:polymeric immunoglobulin receptor-like n=1 Tax=Hemitrygon akajei TaxID=2704970 RepID=UPI003BF97C58